MYLEARCTESNWVMHHTFTSSKIQVSHYFKFACCSCCHSPGTADWQSVPMLDFPAPTSLTSGDYLGQTEPNFRYEKRGRLCIHMAVRILCYARADWGQQCKGRDYICCKLPGPSCPQWISIWAEGWQMNNPHLLWPVPEDISTFVKFGVTGDFPGFIPQYNTAHSLMLASRGFDVQSWSWNI